MCGTYGLKGFAPVNSMPTGWMARTNPGKDIGSISTSCSWTHLRRRSRRSLDSDLGPARGYDPSAPEQDLVCSKVDDAGAMPKCVFTHEHFDWHDDQPLRHPWSKTVIYEMHVRGFTIHPSSGVEHPGTYRGLMEKIPYLKELGVTAVELMPVYEFNECQVVGHQSANRQATQGLLGLRSRGLLCAESILQ